MVNDARITIPKITDSDIEWVCDVLGLPLTAFSGIDGTDPRLKIIRSMDTLDIEACPGSGKTTLLVAKLAILARKWTQSKRGICVLSHTNVARQEIETHLGNTAAGQCLLSYPHFIGTIHSFVNEFLALPWLRSSGYSIEMIDDEICLRRRWRMLSDVVKYGLEKNRHTEQKLRIKDSNFGLGTISWGKGSLGQCTPTYREMSNVCKTSVNEGYFCHDEMFVWAIDLLDKIPNVSEYLRMRFPFLFIDEVQDNSELQTRLLYRVFVQGNQPVIRQRLGDSNQAIYQHDSAMINTELDAFPIAEIRQDMPNSFRFDQSIADLTDSLAVTPQGLQGLRKENMYGKHTIFLFDDETIEHVLEYYAKYLIKVFAKSQLETGLFTAIGAVHRPGNSDRVPRSVPHYWAAYDYELASTKPQPRTFVQFISAGKRLVQQSGEAHAQLELFAEGLLRLIKISNSNLRFSRKKKHHRYVLELLEGHLEAREKYLYLVRMLCIDQVPLTRPAWENVWKEVIAQIAADIAGEELDDSVVEDFLAWGNTVDLVNYGHGQVRSDNIFRYIQDNTTVEIRVGSIHAAKGQTHMATLVLDTFYYTHHLKSLKAWLSNKKSGGINESDSTQSRLRLHYVGMTRPSHLLCLAIREDAMTKADLEKLIGHGWRVCRVTDTTIE